MGSYNAGDQKDPGVRFVNLRVFIVNMEPRVAESISPMRVH